MPPTTLQTFATNYTAAWCSQNPAAVAAHFSPNGTLTINGSASTGRAAITAAAQSFMSAFPDMQVLMDNLIIHESHGATQDTHATYHWTLIGTNTGLNGTGHRVRISGFEEWTIGPDNLIATSDGHFDAAAYQHQLEHGFENTGAP
jgi:predicted ester cyclase